MMKMLALGLLLVVFGGTTSTDPETTTTAEFPEWECPTDMIESDYFDGCEDEEQGHMRSGMPIRRCRRGYIYNERRYRCQRIRG